jgi:hypothetical protein
MDMQHIYSPQGEYIMTEKSAIVILLEVAGSLRIRTARAILPRVGTVFSSSKKGLICGNRPA